MTGINKDTIINPLRIRDVLQKLKEMRNRSRHTELTARLWDHRMRASGKVLAYDKAIKRIEMAVHE